MRPAEQLRVGSSLERGSAAGLFTVPDYDGACITRIVPAILRRRELRRAGAAQPEWMPPAVLDSPQVALLVLDGLGWEQLRARLHVAPVLAAMHGGPVTSVAPTTTATALTSIATGLAPADHGVLGYRFRVAGDEVLNVLRWTTASGDARKRVPPGSIQSHAPFLGRATTAVSRVEFAGTGFTDAHLPGVHLAGWRVASSMAVEIGQLLASGETFVYAYYDGIDKVAHERGLGAHYEAELRAADRLVADILDVLPPGASLVVTADHGQVDVIEPPLVLPAEIMAGVTLLSGEGRFRWLHVAEGAGGDVAEGCVEVFGDRAVVASRDELVASGLFGGELAPDYASRLGDVALVATAPVAFFDPADTGEMKLVARHGAMTGAEVLVPLLAATP